MYKILREGNPKRTYAHVLPELGKLAPLNTHYLQHWLAIIESNINPQLSTILIGLAESSLLPATWLAQHLHFKPKLCLSTRYSHQQTCIHFKEPHSHGPNHSLPINTQQYYQQAIIIEDEITTGQTLYNLIQALKPQVEQFIIFTLADFRQSHTQSTSLAKLTDTVKLLLKPETTIKTMTIKSRQAIYSIGECLPPALHYYHSIDEQSYFRHITRSPWQVDQNIIKTKIHLGQDTENIHHYFYNPDALNNLDKIDIFCYPPTLAIANQLEHWLQTHYPRPNQLITHIHCYEAF